MWCAPSSKGTLVAGTDNLKKTPLNALHHACGGKMVPFAGYEMPVQFSAGVLKEHLHTRASAGLFDVSHMGQARLTGDDPAAALETLVPGDIKALKPGAMRYTLLTSESGGILDDLMVTNVGDHLFVVVNAACKEADFAHMRAKLGGRCSLEILPDQALIAVQGPKAAFPLLKILDMARRPNQPDGFLAYKEKILVGINLVIKIRGRRLVL